MKLLDGALLVGGALRLTRLAVRDDIFKWWIKDPIDEAMDTWFHNNVDDNGEVVEPWWWKYRDGLDCPYCIGFWVSVGVVGSYAIAKDKPLWRGVMGALALNELTAHVGAVIGDYDGDI